MRNEKKNGLLQRRRWRIRKKVRGTVTRPRMSVRFTGKYIHVQFIDDLAGVTIASASTLHKDNPDRAALSFGVTTQSMTSSLLKAPASRVSVVSPATVAPLTVQA